MSATPKFSRAAGATEPARSFVAVTPDDTADLPAGAARALFVGEAGTLSLVDQEGNVVSIVSAASQYHPLQAVRVRATGTTAGGVVALY